MYGSHDVKTPALVAGSDTAPSIHQSDEVTHFLGENWLDNFSDRLMITVRGLDPSIITWTSMRGTVTFRNVAGTWKASSGLFELIDRGANPADGFGRWLVRTTDSNAPRQTWVFEEISYLFGTATETVGRLRRHALTTGGSDVTGFYGFTVNWTTSGLITNAIDTLDTSPRVCLHRMANWMHRYWLPPPDPDDC